MTTQPEEAVKDVPLGAIENCRAFLQRLADHYDFTCEAGSLANCTDYHEAVTCFEFIAQWISGLSALEPSANACPCTKIQQDETCPVVYPSLLCEICDGKGVLQPSAARELALDIETIKGALADLIGHAKWVDVNFDISYAHLHEAETVFSTLSSPDHADAGKVEGDGWLPIDSAPISNGSNRFLAYVKGHGQVVCYRTGIAIYSLSGGHAIYRATHWRPLPTPPSSGVA